VADDLLDTILTRGPSEPVPSLDAWWRRHTEAARGFTRSIDRAIAAGAAMDRVGYAFASGYTSAVRAMVELPDDARGVFCATEAAGPHPRAIATSVIDGKLTGTKTFCTLSTFATDLVVIATEGLGDDGRPRLVAYVVPATADGLSLEAGAELPMVPEIPHAAVSLAVPEAQVRRLPGDGYTAYLKAFRTCEDLHVMAAILAQVSLHALHADWDQRWVERALATLDGLAATAERPYSNAATHLALAGHLDAIRALLEDADTSIADRDDEAAQRWRRDRAIFNVAARVRDKRRLKAWERWR